RRRGADRRRTLSVDAAQGRVPTPLPGAVVVHPTPRRISCRGALALGFRHGGYCIGCCWALVALLFVGGVMNRGWIAALAILVLAEKVVPTGRVLSRIAGAGLIAAGAWLIVQTP